MIEAVLSSDYLRLTAFLWSYRRYSLLSEKKKKNGNNNVFQYWKDSKGKVGQMDVALVLALTPDSQCTFCLWDRHLRQ